jgi:hypothetical protein
MKKKYLFAFIIPFLAIPFLAFAVKDRIDPITPKISSLPCFIKNLLDIMIQLGIPIAAFFLIWAGFLFIQAQGEPAKLTTAKRAFTWAVIGTAVVFGAWLLSTVIKVTVWERIGSNVDINSFNFCGGDFDPPSVPIQMKALLSSNGVAVSWNASTDNVSLFGYNVYRDGVKIGYTTTNSFIDKNLPSSASSYSYTVAADDTAGNTSTLSQVATVNIPPPPPVVVIPPPSTPPSTGGTGDTGGGGAIVPSSVTPPTLVNPVNPMNYGAKCDGVTNDAAAFRAAVSAGDVLVPAGRTCVINSAVNISINNRHIECGSGAILKQNTTGGSIFVYEEPVSGQRLTGNSIANCTFIGTGTVPPTTDWNNSAKHWNIPILTKDRVDNFILIGNTFDRFYGQAMFQTTGSVDGGHGDKIMYNTFKNCGYYGPVFVAHNNGYIGHNTAIDCAIGIENDVVTPPQLTGGNIIENNTITCIYGYGALDMDACAILTGGASYDQDYTTNIVRNNSISGVANAQGAHPGYQSRIIIGTRWGPRIHPAQYINNTCTNGCIVIP